MNEKLDWMLGMVENMKNISDESSDRSLMQELSGMADSMRANLESLKESEVEDSSIDLMEQLMRSMEQVMINLDPDKEQEKEALRHMMDYMLILQRSYLHG